MSGVWMFPGQGNQHVGMLHALTGLASAAPVFEEASCVLGTDVLSLDGADPLAGTRGAQLALLLSGVVTARELLACGAEPAYLAGHSLGSWSAAAVAGVLTFADAVRLVELRGRRMAECAPHGYSMAAILGLSAAHVTALADEVRSQGHPVWASNRNTRSQTAVSGSAEGLDAIIALAQHAGASRAVRLEVAVPAHSPLMQPVADELAAALAHVELGPPRWPLASNVTGRLLRTGTAIGQDLALATAQPVAWAEATAALHERGIDHWVQMSPGQDLMDMVTRQWPDARAWCLDHICPQEAARRIARLQAPP